MGAKYRTMDGYSVEVVHLAGTGEWLRGRYHGFYVADVRSVSELESYFPLDELEEALAPAEGSPGPSRLSTTGLVCPRATGSPHDSHTSLVVSGWPQRCVKIVGGRSPLPRGRAPPCLGGMRTGETSG